MAAGNVIFLAGAPDAGSLTWKDDGGDGDGDGGDPHQLPSHLTFRHRRFLQHRGRGPDVSTPDAPTCAAPARAKWRQVPLHGQTQWKSTEADTRHVTGEAPRRLSFRDHCSNGDAERRGFWERSRDAGQNPDSSHPAVPEHGSSRVTADDASTVVSGTPASTALSLHAPRDSLSSHASDHPAHQVVSFHGPITDLNRLPSARYLDSIRPQTMTVHVLAGVIAVQPTRAVRLRRRAGTMDVVPVLVGDETAAAFPISFWLPPADGHAHGSSAGRGALRDVVQALRPGHVVLVTHVALDGFKNAVHGQSLSRHPTRIGTTVTRLAHNATAPAPPFAAKLSRVREWSANFVRSTSSPPHLSPHLLLDSTTKQTTHRHFPPDTQPGES